MSAAEAKEVSLRMAVDIECLCAKHTSKTLNQSCGRNESHLCNITKTIRVISETTEEAFASCCRSKSIGWLGKECMSLSRFEYNYFCRWECRSFPSNGCRSNLFYVSDPEDLYFFDKSRRYANELRGRGWESQPQDVGRWSFLLGTQQTGKPDSLAEKYHVRDWASKTQWGTSCPMQPSSPFDDLSDLKCAFFGPFDWLSRLIEEESESGDLHQERKMGIGRMNKSAKSDPRWRRNDRRRRTWRIWTTKEWTPKMRGRSTITFGIANIDANEAWDLLWNKWDLDPIWSGQWCSPRVQTKEALIWHLFLFSVPNATIESRFARAARQ
jgi:hypothetical protein